MDKSQKEILEKELAENNGILQMKPCWVTRSYLPAGHRLGLTKAEYDAGKRGEIAERWIVSETQADNAIFTPHEGQSVIKLHHSDEQIYLPDALAALKDKILGKDYYKKHQKLDRLLKIYDYKTRLFYHIHQMQKDMDLIGKKSKEEAYYYLETDVGAHPETFFGVHPSIVKDNLIEKVFIPYLKAWKGNDILKYSYAYVNTPGEGFHIPAGILHAPGTALTLELQESSDVMAVFQAEIEGIPQDRHLLGKDIAEEKIKALGVEKAALEQVDWQACIDPFFWENHHLSPLPIKEKTPDGVKEDWVWYDTTTFNGMRITIAPGKEYTTKANGLYGLFIWQGKGFVEQFPVEGQKVSLTDSNDEFLITHDKAVEGIHIRNTGSKDLVAFKFFGPDINNDIVPYLKQYRS
jgi:hypothetical protein